MGFISDFKAFAMQGNVVDLAVGVVIGAAFGKIVTALVDDVIMPVLSLLMGGRNFDNLFTVLSPGSDGAGSYATLADAQKAGANVLAYGHLIGSIVDFIIIALCIFMVVRAIARLHRKKEEAPAPAAISSTDALLIEIRDSLKSRGV